MSVDVNKNKKSTILPADLSPKTLQVVILKISVLADVATPEVTMVTAGAVLLCVQMY